jgi:general secretion pathway protein D
MRRSNSLGGFIAAAVLLTAAGCATAPPERTVTPPPIPVPAPTVTVETEPAAPPMPPVSVGPRAEAPTPPPPVTAPPPTPAPPPPAKPPVTRPSIGPPPVPGAAGRFIVLNFDNADIETVIHAASEIVGFNYVLSPDVRGKVTVQTSGRIPQDDVFGVLLGILEVHGFTAVKAGNLYKIVRLEGARERAVPTIVGDIAVDTRNADEIITQIVPIRHASVNDLGVLLRPFVSSRGTLVANRETNVLVITDSVANVRRVLDIVKLVDVQVSLDEVQIIPVAFADATEVAAILNQLFAGGRLRAAAAPGAPAAAPPGVPAGPAGAPTVTERPPLVIAEKRSNSIVVHGRRSEIETIRRILTQLDVNVTGGRRVFIYFAENAKAKDLAATLNAIYGAKETVPTAAPTPPTQPRTPGQPPPPPPPPPTSGPGGPIGGPSTLADIGLAEGQFRFIADETTNSIIVTTTPRQWTDIEPTVRQLDKMPRQVLIEVLVAEITLQDDTKLGMDWALKTGSFRFVQQSITTSTGGTPTVNAPTGLDGLGAATAIAGLPGAGLTAFAFATDKFFAMLNALASENRVNVISNPHVMTSENKKAIVNVSTSIPIVTSQQTGTLSAPVVTTGTTLATTGSLNQTVEYRDAGVVLTVTPRIGERGTVALDVKQEVNDIGDPEPPTGSRRINKREAETAVVLLNNQTLVMAGLIQERRGASDRGIPILSRIPFLGFLFGFKERTVEKRELILLITPRVVGTPVDAQRVTDQMRRATPELDQAVRQAPRPPTTAPIPTPGTLPSGGVVPPAPPAPERTPGGVPAIPPAPPQPR